MIKRLLPLTGYLVLVALIIGCSGSGGFDSPITPPDMPDTQDLTDGDLSAATATEGGRDGVNGGHALWGLWQGTFDPETGELEIVSLRHGQFHVNVTGNLQPPAPPGLSISINDFNPPQGTVDLDLTIKHPFPNTNLRGFDVRGIVMGAGDTIQSTLDSGIVYSAPSGMRLANADGYSRWWNAQEFTTPGMYGFTPGILGMGFFTPETTLNPYKYFSDPLLPGDPVIPKIDMSNRGTFSTDTDPPELTRNYQLQFPMGPGGNPIWLFQYAIDASWAPPTGSSPPPKPIEDYPIQANCPEAFHIDVDTSGTTAWFVGPGDSGGDLVLAIEVFDWGAPSNFDGINGEIHSILVESDTLFDSVINVDLSPGPGSQTTSGIYTVTIPDVHPTGLEDQEILITIRSSDPSTYAPPIPGSAYPSGAALAAYAIIEMPISDEAPEDPYITVDIPNGGEAWVAGGTEEITWTSFGDVGLHVGIGYTISDGPFNSIVPSTDNDGSYIWDPIADIDSEEVKVVIISVESPTISDESDDFFSITTVVEPEIIVTIPNGGEVWEVGSAQDITWTSVGDVGFEVSIDYTVDDGPPINIVPFTDNDGTYLWVPIPDIESNHVIVIITSVEYPTISDDSDNYFTITSVPDPQIIVTIPNGDEIWEAGGAEEITWTSIGPVGFEVRIDYTINDGPPVNIISMTDNDGSYIWDPIADIESDVVRVVVSSFINPLITDESDGFFTITSTPVPEITVVVPNGGEIWEVGSSKEITWTSVGDVGAHVKIEYMISWGIPVIIIDSTDNDGSFTWDPIPDEESDEVVVIITSVENPTIKDESNDFFTITATPQPEITVTIPNGGEIWKIGTSQFFEWTSQDLTGQVKIEYTLSDGDLPIEIIAATDDTGSYEWNPIPTPATDTARVIITSIDFPAVTDASNDFFTISEPQTLTLTSPDGGETLHGSGDWEITWDWTGDIDFVNLLLSTDSGGTYPTTIVDLTPCDGSFMWDPIPDLDTTTARIIVELGSDPLINDESNADFIITTVGPDPGWNPISGLTQISLTSPAPDQDTEPEDIMVFSIGLNESIGEIVDGPDDNAFWGYNDFYTGTLGTSWGYSTLATPLHKFDVRPDGAYVFVTNANSDSFPNPLVNDPMYCAYSANDNVTGEMPDTYWHLYGDIGDPDPDALRWFRCVDFSCGVPGGIDDTTAYHLVVYAEHPDNPQPHDGNLLLGAWDDPYDGASNSALLLDTSTQGGGQGLVDDTVPGLMALAADDNTDLVIGTEEVVGLWVLDSVGIVQCHAVAFTTGDFVFPVNQLDSDEYGAATPVDVEIAPAKAFGYEVTDPGYNWLVALLDNGDGTWSVGVWEFDYAADPLVFVEIDITDPLPGVPLAVDVDGTDFEIHVLADNGGTIEATVFDYTP